MFKTLPFFLICTLGICTLKAKGQAPVADFTASVTSGCGPLGVTFTDKSSNNPTSWAWDFGNGQISSQRNPYMLYSIPGTYTVTLIVKNGSGANSIRKTNYITVFPYPQALFGANLTLACAPATVQFIDKSTPGAGTITSWKWTFGDGASSSLQAPSHTYSTPGFYNVGLKVTNSQGCSNELDLGRYIRVVQGVQASFAYTQVSASCSAPFDVNFQNQTAGPGNLTYTWNLGNGVNSNAANPSTVYPANQSYTVTLLAQSDLGCSDTAIRVVNFQGGNASITAPATACINTPITLQNSSTPAPISSAWNFGDGTGSTLQNPSKTWSAPSNYTVQLINTYGACNDTVTQVIQVSDTAKPDFTSSKPGSCKAPFSTNFQDLTPAGTATGWHWDFGDGTTSNLQNPAHNYTTTGVFDVTLTVTGATGCTGTVIKKGFINVGPPLITLSPPSQYGCTGIPYLMNYNVSSVDGIATYQWSAPAANLPNTSTLPTPSFIWSATGVNTVNLTVTTNDGCTASFSFPTAVYTGTPTPPTFTVTPPDDCASTTFQFTATGNPADHWTWDFGDGDTSMTGPITLHHYGDTGFHNVTLTVVNNGCSQTGTIPNAVHIKPPLAKFGYKPDCTDPNRLLINFSDSSIVDVSIPGTSYTLDYGDGTPPVTVNAPPFPPVFPPHSYSTYGTYPASLSVTNGSCTSTYPLPVKVTPQTTDFIFQDSICRNVNFTWTASGIDTSIITNYHWVLSTAPPTIADTKNASFSAAISTDGPYTLQLTITDKYGCMGTSPIHTFQVTGPVAQFSLSPIGGCRNTPILLTDQSVPDPTHPLKTWIYDWGDGTSQTSSSPITSHSYPDTGQFLILLTVFDTRSCAASFHPIDTVKITAPKAIFAGADSFYCPNVPFPFTDSSTGQNLIYNWDFGDGATDNTANPSHSYTAGGRYTVKLKITDQAGCTDSLVRNNYVWIQAPIPAFTMTDSTTICPPLQTTFLPLAKYYDSLYWNFGDGSTSNLPYTTHFYNNYGPPPNYSITAYLVLRGPGGCLDSVGHNVYLANPFNATFLYSPLQACDSVPVTFNVVPPPFSRFTLVFTDGTADSSNILNPPPFHMFRNPGTYTPQLVMYDSTGCIVGIGSGSGNITVLGSVPFFSMDKKKFCDSGLVNFTDFTITNDPITNETWSFGDGTTGNTPNPSHYYSAPGILTPQLIVNTQHNCTEIYTDTIHVYQTPHPAINSNSILCTGFIQFEGSLTVPDPVDTIHWAWNFGDGQTASVQNPSVKLAPGTFNVQLKTFVSFGCSDTTSKTYTINPLPVVKGPSVITTPVGIPVTIPFAYSENVNTFSWTPAANLSCTDCANPQASPVFATLYTVTVTDANGCTNTDSILVKTICDGQNYFVPNTFSPNGDGVNDVFYPRGNGLYNIQSMRVFNRWGQIVFERKDFPANSAAQGWDGNFNGRPAQADVYVYIIEVVCNNAQVVTLKGDLTLIR